MRPKTAAYFIEGNTMESEAHKWLKEIGCKFLKEKGMNVIAREVSIKCGDCDVCGLNFKRKEVRIVECKQSLQDYIRDKKLFDLQTSYYPECHYFYIICPENVIPVEKVVDGIGLIYVKPNDEYYIVKKPVKNKSRLKTLFDSTLKRAVHRLSNEVYYRNEKEYKDATEEKYKRKAEIYFSAVKCPYCKHVTKDLIHIHKSMSIKCKHCKKDIIIKDANVRYITGYNQTFISRLQKLALL